MKILSVNAGSSSLKFQLYEMPEEKVLISGVFERIGIGNSFYTIKLDGEKIKKEVELKDHKMAFEKLVSELMDNKVINSCDEIKAVGHRTVQGGEKYDPYNSSVGDEISISQDKDYNARQDAMSKDMNDYYTGKSKYTKGKGWN